MKDLIDRKAAIKALCGMCRYEGTANCKECEHPINDIPSEDAVPAKDYRDCRNELCLRCGEYQERHLGACDGCRWKP